MLVCVLERIAKTDVEQAYADFRQRLLENGCRVISEEAPKRIVVKQGSLWGVSPKTAKKLISLRFSSHKSGTQVLVSSTLASDWKNITLIGSTLSIILIFVCVWIATDLNAFAASGAIGFWSWIAMVDGYVNVQVTQTFAGVTSALAVFLAVIIALEGLIVVYVKRKLDGVVEATLKSVG